MAVTIQYRGLQATYRAGVWSSVDDPILAASLNTVLPKEPGDYVPSLDEWAANAAVAWLDGIAHPAKATIVRMDTPPPTIPGRVY